MSMVLNLMKTNQSCLRIAVSFCMFMAWNNYQQHVKCIIIHSLDQNRLIVVRNFNDLWWPTVRSERWCPCDMVLCTLYWSSGQDKNIKFIAMYYTRKLLSKALCDYYTRRLLSKALYDQIPFRKFHVQAVAWNMLVILRDVFSLEIWNTHLMKIQPCVSFQGTQLTFKHSINFQWHWKPLNKHYPTRSVGSIQSHKNYRWLR